MLRISAILSFCILTSGCINQSWMDAKHTPDTSRAEIPVSQLQPAAGTQPPSTTSSDTDFKMCGNYYEGKGVPKNDVEAFAYCKSSAQKGNPNAMYNLGLFYQKGEGVSQNPNEAQKWFKAAADKGQSDAKFNLKQIDLAQKGGMGVPQKPPTEAPSPPTALAQNAAAPAAPTSASAANAIAPAAGGVIGGAAAFTATNNGPSMDLAQYCLIAAQRGNADKKCKFDAAPQANQIPQTDSSVTDLMAQAKAGNAQAQNDLGVLYRRGLSGVKKDPAEAQKLFQSAAAKGSPNGMMNLASIYKDGDVQQNLELSYAWYNLAGDRLPPNDPRKAKAQDNVKEISKYLNNQQIGNALQYVSKLDEKIPMINSPAAQAQAQTATATTK